MRMVRNGRTFGDGFNDAPLHQCLALSLAGFGGEEDTGINKGQVCNGKDETREKEKGMLGGVNLWLLLSALDEARRLARGRHDQGMHQ